MDIENMKNKFSHIKGWGVDADQKNEPTYPFKKYTGDDHKRLNWERPAQQPKTVEILSSIERPNISAVFGTAAPPSGLSGVIRRRAFQYSENVYRHWLPLLLADRVNVVEGVIQDIGEGKIPNIFAERGWKALWKHKRSALVKDAALVIVIPTVIATVIAFAFKRK